ncbi:hypothetical protein [Dickeya sp. Secpp 1600]|uniref:hypothetical protein n=1 Tax=Dickeya sp. Secpp 1600 TaxID=2037915 RepID=UPI000D321415|nr:hypothetical protein [Dickeya sp. Secpp 1600]
MFINQYLLSEPRLYELLLTQLPLLLSGECSILPEKDIEAVTYNSWYQRQFMHTDPMFERHWDHLLARQRETKGWCRALLGQAARYHLEDDSRRLAVRQSRFGEWQNWVANQSGFPVIAYQLEQMWCGKVYPQSFELLARLKQTLGYRPIVSPWHPRVEDYLRREGLHEAHMHLNGTTFVELMWHHSLLNPDELINEMENCRKDDPTRLRRFYAVASSLDAPVKVSRMLHIARYCREWLLRWAEGRYHPECEGKPARQCFAEVLRCNDIVAPDSGFFAWEQAAYAQEQQYQGLCELHFHIRVLHALRQHPSVTEDACYWLYVLCMNLFQRLLVQRTDQIGFDQFQKFTELGPREPIEKDYAARFYQLHGEQASGTSVMATVEGRFAPKSNIEENVALITRILDGFWRYRHPSVSLFEQPQELNALARDCHSVTRPTLRLVVHFIKRRWDYRDGSSHFSVLREDVLTRAHSLFQVLDEFPALRSLLTGFDAAANEREAPPDVFAVLFRQARRQGIAHFTYHAGEDFEHLISGIRAVYDSLTLLELSNGDRIGHATAIGIMPTFWRMKMTDTLFIKQGEWLEDLLFVRKLLLEQREGGDLSLVRLDSEIAMLAYRIFERHPSAVVLQHFFDGRGLDPIQVRNYLQDHSDRPIGWVGEEFDRVVEFANRHGQEALSLLKQRWFDAEAIKRYEVSAEFDTAFLPDAILLAAQQYVQKRIREKQVVIETLPTSNVRISYYDDITQHHVFRWMHIPGRYVAGDHRMSVALGSDDQGIFVTDMKGEFYHLFTVLMNEFHYSEQEALAQVAALNENGRIYRFDYPL